MAKKSLLLVDADSKSLRMLEVSLRKGGFSVTTAVDATDAWDKLRHAVPDLIIADTKLPGGVSGLEFVADLKRVADTASIPVVFLASDASLSQKVAGLELGVDDYLTKPIYIKEVLTRVRVLLDKRDKQKLEGRERSSSFSGLLGDMGLVDLAQTVELGRKTGRLVIHAGRDRGLVAFRDGRVVNARCGRLVGERAFYRMLVWGEGTFSMEFVAHHEPDVITASTQALLMEGVRRVDEWGRLAEQLPPVDHVFEIDFDAFADRLAQIPDEVNALLRSFDGRRTLLQVIDETDFGDLEALELASKLFFEGLIVDRTTRDGEADTDTAAPWLHEPAPFPDDVDGDGGLLVPNDTMPPTAAMASVFLPRIEDILAPPEGVAASVAASVAGSPPPPLTPVAPPPPPPALELSFDVPGTAPQPPKPVTSSMPPVPALPLPVPPLGMSLPPLAMSSDVAAPRARPLTPVAATTTPRPLPGPPPEEREARAVAQRASVNALTWSSTAVPQTAPDDGWEDVQAPIEERRLTNPPAIENTVAPPPPPVLLPSTPAAPPTTSGPTTSGPPTIIEPAPGFAGDEDLGGRIAAQLDAATKVPEAALPPELASPSTGFDDADSDGSRATPAQRPPTSSASDDIFDEPTDTGRRALAAAAGEAVPPSPPTAPATASSSSAKAADASARARRADDAVDPRVAAGIHDTRTALVDEPLEDLVIDRFGFSRGAAVAMFVAGFVAVLVVMLLIRRADADAADAGAPVVAPPVVLDAGRLDAGAVDAGAVDAGAAVASPDAGPTADAGVVTDAGTVVADAGVVDAGVEGDGDVDANADAGPVDAEQAEYDLQLKRAENFSRRGDFGRSVRAYKAALALRRDSVTAHLGLGEAYYELDNLTAALLHLERARVLAPKDPQVYVLLGAAYQSAGRKSDAIRAYERHLLLQPEGKTAHDVRAILRGLKN